MMSETATNRIHGDDLRRCGLDVGTLSSAEQEALDRDGYVVFPSVIDANSLDRLRKAFEEASSQGRQVSKESGTRHINDLVNGDPVFQDVYTHPKILAAVHHVLQCPFRLSQIGGRDPLPGFGQQGLHADWFVRAKGEPFQVVTTTCLLDDFTANNGATRLVPGTHHLLTQPPKSLSAPANRHPEQKVIVATAGSVLAFNGHLWHSGTRNDSRLRRRVLQCVFVGRNELRSARPTCDAPDRLSSAARYILGL
ncbi:MAG TPA: phytanoyl-CoA dioxygenase family protein [Blastocatellia bacterium]|jgi:ectoine hydroxylase-related dioxygenase (phytanoyl-CoA dioxygenase family)|nr:phytanoyl-CoA dioxygenase family protein [Blastocatellia bacterium]